MCHFPSRHIKCHKTSRHVQTNIRKCHRINRHFQPLYRKWHNAPRHFPPLLSRHNLLTISCLLLKAVPTQKRIYTPQKCHLHTPTTPPPKVLARQHATSKFTLSDSTHMPPATNSSSGMHVGKKNFKPTLNLGGNTLVSHSHTYL